MLYFLTVSYPAVTILLYDGDTFYCAGLTGDRRDAGRLEERATQEGEYSDARSNPAMLRLSIKYE